MKIIQDGPLTLEWVKTARRAQIVFGLVVFLGVTIMPPVRDVMVEVVAPDDGAFFGRKKQRRALRTLRRVWDTVYWVGGLGTAGALLVLHAPVVIGRRRDGAPGSKGSNGTAGFGTGEAAEEATLYATSTGSSAGSSSPSVASSSSPGSLVATEPGLNPPGGRYAIAGELGRGGMGVVYRAHDPVLDRELALKELPPTLLRDPTLAARFRNEARVLARLMHPGIVQIFDLVEDQQGMWMAMEMVTGGSLDEVLEDRGKLPSEEVVSLGIEMAEAMAYAHEQGVVHRDFKPHNVLLTPDGHPKVTDFGLAKLAQGPALTQEGSVMGSPTYMSPEQAAGMEADARADIYSLGVTLYQMLAGRPPFVGATSAVLMKQITQPPPRPSELVDLPAALEALLLRMLEKEPDDRPPTMSHVAESLRGLL